MERRRFVTSAALGGAALGAVASVLPKPAIAQGLPEIKWRMASSFPKSLPALFGGADFLCQRVAALTDNRFQIRPFAGGEIVPPLAVLDAVQNGTVELGHSTPYYYVGKDPTFGFGSTMPFGFNERQQMAWMRQGGGLELHNELLKGYNTLGFPAGNTGAQMGGWFRKEIKTPEDLKGLKMRIAGIAGNVLAKLGGVPQQIGGSDIYPALEKGTIDATEWVGPYDDEKLGFYKVAKYYYYPGWWEGNAMIWTNVNRDKWNELPPSYQAALETASYDAYSWVLSKYDTENPLALRRLVANGAQLRPFSREILQAAYKASFEVYDEFAAKNALFKKTYESWKAFRDTEYLWFQVAEHSFESFVYSQRTAEVRAKK
ncbi:Alpha-keto acid-binding periplasmic protein TakP [Rhodovastum atsumiense]|uniref:Twin-arginine translocation signal domain-containing protein n=1 Tax=Rhodovastum atsumiense TaxID=504468 RepID=A0A5M6J1C4_9PROT|nr:TRAP transporter substrate-binding protein [Rhodovastum atsumiense]KAA5614311.1 twin-arginine translocation signal domain-containing protein [Rhodovastum atsumiense]CAH2604772.1 Alpha-keto acid-binding periplasmic protein TakP [Rhodovastum atsumiense]